ncbi:hypothetical protein U1Q18_007742, partial [Sarracenia purpurea var. burkii]
VGQRWYGRPKMVWLAKDGMVRQRKTIQGNIMGISWKYHGISWEYHGISWVYHENIMEYHGDIMGRGPLFALIRSGPHNWTTRPSVIYTHNKCDLDSLATQASSNLESPVLNPQSDADSPPVAKLQSRISTFFHSSSLDGDELGQKNSGVICLF